VIIDFCGNILRKSAQHEVVNQIVRQTLKTHVLMFTCFLLACNLVVYTPSGGKPVGKAPERAFEEREKIKRWRATQKRLAFSLPFAFTFGRIGAHMLIVQKTRRMVTTEHLDRVSFERLRH
jgi:hypothetical protein